MVLVQAFKKAHLECMLISACAELNSHLLYVTQNLQKKDKPGSQLILASILTLQKKY